MCHQQILELLSAIGGGVQVGVAGTSAKSEHAVSTYNMEERKLSGGGCACT